MNYDLFIIHAHDNNAESQAHLNYNSQHFSNQCAKVYDLLMSGQTISVLTALTEHQISSFPRRLLDLKELGYRYSFEWIRYEGKAKYKVWYCTNEDYDHNKELFNNKNKNNK